MIASRESTLVVDLSWPWETTPRLTVTATVRLVTVACMTEETRMALLNYDWMVRNRGLDEVALDWASDTLVYGDGGATFETLCEPGFTPATAGDWHSRL